MDLALFLELLPKLISVRRFLKRIRVIAPLALRHFTSGLLERAEPGFQLLHGQVPMHGAGLDHMPSMPIFDHKPGPARLQLQAVSCEALMRILPGTRVFQQGQNGLALVAGIAFKRLSACVGFHSCGPIAQALLLDLITAVVDDKAVFLLQLPAQPVAFDIVPPGLHAREPFRMDQIVGNVHMHVFGVDVDAAMPLMLRKAQSIGKTLLNSLENFRRQPGFIFRVKADNQVVGLFLSGARVEGLSVCYLLYGQFVIIPGPAPGAPAHEAFFRLYIFGKISVPSHAAIGTSIKACISRQKIRSSSFLSLRVRCQTAFGQLTHAVSGNAFACFKVALRIMESLSIAQLHIMLMPGGDIIRQPGVVVVLRGTRNAFADHNALILTFRLA